MQPDGCCTLPRLASPPGGPLRTSLPRPAVTVAKLEVVQATERLQTLWCPIASVCDVCCQLIWTPTGGSGESGVQPGGGRSTQEARWGGEAGVVMSASDGVPSVPPCAYEQVEV